MPHRRGLPPAHLPLGAHPDLNSLPLSAALLLAAAGACAGGPPADNAPAFRSRNEPGIALPGISVQGDPLDARALIADMAFHFPGETSALIRGLLRTEFARREGMRLELAPDASEVERSWKTTREGILKSLDDGQDLDSWARERYGRNGQEVSGAIRKRLEENQLYQLVARADALLTGRYRLHMLMSRNKDLAGRWARKARAGADLRSLAKEADDAGPAGNGAWPPLPVYLPDPLGAAVADLEPGGIAGPLRLEGDQGWLVARLVEKLPPLKNIPPVSELLHSLRTDPVSAFEARAWFEKMLRRYTAKERLPDLLPPENPFVPRP